MIGRTLLLPGTVMLQTEGNFSEPWIILHDPLNRRNRIAAAHGHPETSVPWLTDQFLNGGVTHSVNTRFKDIEPVDTLCARDLFFCFVWVFPADTFPQKNGPDTVHRLYHIRAVFSS